MPTEIPLRCRCGAVQAVARDISPETSSHMACYCVDCQAFARFLGQEGLLNAKGGTSVFLAAPAGVRILSGADQLACVRLSEKGMFRWYTRCCRTPVGNTAGSRVLPMIMVPGAFVDRRQTGATPESVLGPAVGIKGSAALGGVPEGVHPELPVGPIAGMLWRVLRAKLSGKTDPSPFKGPDTAQARARAQVLTPSERAALG
jgi:hypothetical protein